MVNPNTHTQTVQTENVFLPGEMFSVQMQSGCSLGVFCPHVKMKSDHTPGHFTGVNASTM